MKVGIYNRWLSTLGGGEKHSLAIAEYLSKNHEVYVVSHQAVSRDEASRRFNLDLSRVNFKVIPSRSSIELKDETGHYDLFINSSFMDFIPSIAPHSAALIYFPAPLGNSAIPRFRYRFGWAIKRIFMVPTISEGYIRIINDSSHRRVVEASSPVRLKLPKNSDPYEVSFLLASLLTPGTKISLILDGHLIETLSFSVSGEYKSIHLFIPGSPNRDHELIIEKSCFTPSTNNSSCLLLTNLVVHTQRFKVFHSTFDNFFAKYSLRFQLLPLPHSSILEQIDTYDALWANSAFTQRWIRSYWNRESEILYPPVDIGSFSASEKKNQILSVGRFFAGDHNKKQTILVRAFREMVDEGLQGWDLHLVGGSTPGEIHQKYVADTISDAKGYPIYIHTDLPRPNLLNLYNQSAVYWHASGYGDDENRDPVKFEHFGITTVEAMAAGCVPIVIGKGGQAEIVHHGKNGFLWKSTDGLKHITMKLVRDSGLRAQISAVAQVESRNYSIEKFQIRLDELLKNIGVN